MSKLSILKHDLERVNLASKGLSTTTNVELYDDRSRDALNAVASSLKNLERALVHQIAHFEINQAVANLSDDAVQTLLVDYYVGLNPINLLNSNTNYRVTLRVHLASLVKSGVIHIPPVGE